MVCDTRRIRSFTSQVIVRPDRPAGFDLGTFVRAVFANPAASGFVADVLISSAVFWVLIASRSQHGPSPAPFIALNCLIGLSCALPAYLYVCALRDDERALVPG